MFANLAILRTISENTSDINELWRNANHFFMILEIIFSVADKLLPEVIKKFIPLVKVQPKSYIFVKSEWKSNFSFFLYNQHRQVLFDVYLLIEIDNSKTEDFELSKIGSPKDLKISIGNIEMNYEVLRLNCIAEDDKEFILLKIARMDPESFLSFQITANTDGKIKFKILKYSKKQSIAMHKPQEGAVSFEIPLKKKRKIRLKGVALLMKKND